MGYGLVRIVKLIVPSLGRNEEATPEGIAEIIPLLAGKDDPFAILEQSEFTYAQTLWTPNGYDLEYQEQNIMNHHRIKSLLPKAKLITVLQSYLSGDPNWNSGLEFSRKEVADLPTKVGYSIGQFFGSLIRGFKETRRNKDSNH